MFRRVMTVLLLGMVLSFAGTASVRADDAAFSAVSKELKSRYRARQRKIPFLGLANFAVKLVRPAGVKSFKLRVFEHLQTSGKERGKDWAALLRTSLSPQWQPVVTVYSRKTGEQTHIYARYDGNDIKLFVFTLDGTEATLVRVKLNPQTMAKWMENPKVMGISLGNSFR